MVQSADDAAHPPALTTPSPTNTPLTSWFASEEPALRSIALSRAFRTTLFETLVAGGKTFSLSDITEIAA